MQRGAHFSFRVDNQRDRGLIKALLYEIGTSGPRGPHIDDIRQLVQLLRHYDLDETIRMLKSMNAYGIVWEIRGDISSDHVKAREAYEKSSQKEWFCGTCKLARCLAEGRGCQKDLARAKVLLQDVTLECPEAEQFIDWYGLR